jgi:hypothetical protein
MTARWWRRPKFRQASGTLGSGIGARGAALHGELNLSDGGGRDLPEAAGHGDMRSAEGLDGDRPKGRRRGVMDRSERGPVVGWSSGSRLADRGRAEGNYPWWRGAWNRGE